MIYRHTILLFLLLVTSLNTWAQKTTHDKILVLNPHPTDNEKFVARFHNKETLKILEYWEMGTKVADINANNFNQLRKEQSIYPDGKCYTFYTNGKRKTESVYENGFRVGDKIGYYPNGEIKYTINTTSGKTGYATFYYQNGETKRIETYERGQLNGQIKGSYSDGQKQYIASYLKNQLNGKYQSFYINGAVKRKAKFEQNKEISAKCYDINGKEIECSPFLTPLNYQNNLSTLKSEIEKLDFSFNSQNTDTTDFRIILEIDTLGNADLITYNFKHADSLQSRLKDWAKQLQPFSPAILDGIPTAAYLNMSFTVSAGNVIWLGENVLTYANTAPEHKEELKPTWFWEAPNPSSQQVFFMVDHLPQFKGGERALQSFLSDHLQYPQQARKQRIQGKVFVSFIVEKDGKVTNPKIAKSVHHLLDAEAIRVINLLPDWEPGTRHGMAARVSFTVPINFGLN